MTQSSAQRTAAARGLWSTLIDDEEPTAAQLAEVLAHLQIPEVRDRLCVRMSTPLRKFVHTLDPRCP
ncbi:hypothetical protein [Arthrobacter sp. Soil762]|uniref:hypothetical protein n=1 Tax=Arthrobacter sp. Soil762 TaxID=1736401 RepID=UPI0006F92BD4|nr:hypothetical protein [Arthrobacter sp. Soil762]KRE72766.1 hypothetical protein ASG77_08880 [Arthrobacter sp. Soil762]